MAGGLSPETGIIIALLVFVFIYFVRWLLRMHRRPPLNKGSAATYSDDDAGSYAVVPDHRIKRATTEEFLRKIAHDRPIRFSRRQLARYTSYYSTRLGTGSYGTVYEGKLPNGLQVAVKVLHRGVDWRPEAQFIADVGAIGRTKHPNLVRLFGFCFDDPLRAFVCEYVERGALGAFLLRSGRDAVGIPTLHSLAVGVARGIRHLHEECRPMVVHHDIRPDNVVLDGALTPKVAVTDIGLARLLNRAADHATAWMRPRGVVEKCDVYGFGMLVLEMVSQWRRSFDEGSSESREWFPKLAWTKYEGGNLVDLVTVPSSGLGDDDHTTAINGDDLQERTETVERMCKVAFWCVQQQPEARPPMGAVVKMLVGEMDIPSPVNNPFTHLMAVPVWANDDVQLQAMEAICWRSGGKDATWMYPDPISVDCGLCSDIAPDLVECCFA